MTVPKVEPTRISAGDTLKFTRELADFPASTWTLRYYLYNSEHAFNFASSADGDTFSIDVAKAATALWKPGEYKLSGVVSTADEQYTIYDGLLTVFPNKVSSQPIEYRTWAERTLASLLKGLELDAGRGAVIEYTINGRTFRLSYTEALKLKDNLQAQIASEQAGPFGLKPIKTRFQRPR